MTASALDRPLRRFWWLPLVLRGRLAAVRRSRQWGRRLLGWLLLPLHVLLVPALVALASGPVRGVACDRYVASVIMRHTAWLAQWLAHGWLHPRLAAGVEQLLNYAPLGLLLLAVAVFVTRLHNFLPLVCISWIAMLEGRKASYLDLTVALALPLALAVALTRYDSVGGLAWGAFSMAYMFCRLAYDGTRLEQIWKWRVRMGGHIDGGANGACD